MKSILAVSLLLATSTLPASGVAAPPTMADVIAASIAADWRAIDPANTLYMELATGRVIIELAPNFAPRTIGNIKTMAREHYYDGISINRVQDNYVVQWGDASEKKPLGTATKTVKPELSISAASTGKFTALADGDIYADKAGFSNSFPSARDDKTKQAWLTHCYGMVGVGRDVAPESGNGAELYVVIGHAPRHLDKNVTIVGRVVQGIELLSALPRGTGALGFYAKPEQRIAIKSIHLASETPIVERTNLEVIRTDTPTFKALVESRRHRVDDWFVDPVGHIELCNVPLPVRKVK